MPLVPRKRKDSPNWWFRGTINGEKIFISSGILHGGRKTPPDEVIELCRQKEKELSSTGRSSFGDAIDAYIRMGGSPRFLTPINEKLGSVPLSAFNQQIIDQAAIDLYPECTVQTRNRQFYTPFIAVWSYASMGQNAMCQPIRWGRPKGSTTLTQVRKPVSFQDAVKFINACPDYSAKIMLFLFWTGCRPIEALTLECEKVDIKKRLAVLEESKGHVRGIPLHKSLIPMLKEEIKKGGRVFRSSTGEPYADNKKVSKSGRIISQGGGNFAASLKPAKKLGLDITPYTARHTVSTYLADRVSPYKKDAILGHSRSISAHYVHTPQKELIQAIDLLPDAQKLGCKLLGEVYNRSTEKKGKKRGS